VGVGWLKGPPVCPEVSTIIEYESPDPVTDAAVIGSLGLS